jgi:hypothetical protein
MKIFVLTIGLLVLCACNATKTLDPVSTGGNINANAPYLWDLNALPRNLKISEDFSDDEVISIQNMSNAWESGIQNKKNFFNNQYRTQEISAPNLNLDGLGDDNVNGIYKITSWPLSLSSGALAVTQIFGKRYNSGQENEFVKILHADVLINENNYNFRTQDPGLANSFDLSTVVLHELGHFLGLGHKYGNTIMVPSIGNQTSIQLPTSIDIADMADKYGVSLALLPASAMAVKKMKYEVSKKATGIPVKILIELHAHGLCLHKEDGVILKHHLLSEREMIR